MLDRLTIEDFRARLEETFQIELDGGVSLPLQVVRVRSLSEERVDPDLREPFAVELRGPGEPVLHQSIYPVQCPDWGCLEIFLVPLGPDRIGMLYEAVFT